MTRSEPPAKGKFTTILQAGTTIVDFTAPRCAPCTSQEIVLKDLEKAYEGRLSIQRIDIDQYPEIAVEFDVQSIPTLILFQHGKEVHRFIGLQNRTILTNYVDAILDVTRSRNSS